MATPPTPSPATPPPAPQREMRRGFNEIWTAATLELIQALSHDPAWTTSDATGPSSLPTDLAAHWELAGTLNGKLSLKFHRAAARAWAQLLRAGYAETEAPPSPTSPLSDREREAFDEVVHQLATRLAAALNDGGWGELQVQVRHIGPLRRTVEGADSEFPLRFAKPETPPLEFDLVVEPALRDQIRRGPRPPGEETGGERPGAAKLDLLLDVELDVTLRFGGRQMLLHDVLELAPGSVLELDRHIDDPVELLVGGKVIAWGEVVVVDGNYGLRITRLVHRKERMAAMGAAR